MAKRQEDEKMIFCMIRKSWVKALPEEIIRQQILSLMVEQLGFPASLIGVEKQVHHLPHLMTTDCQLFPKRRVDIVCFAKDLAPNGTLFPLLSVECKATKLTTKVLGQILGYNHYIRASYIAIANGEEIQTGWKNAKTQEWEFVNFLPPYKDLCATLCST